MKLTEPQRQALARARKRPLIRDRAGWGQGSLWHVHTQTVEALERRGLLRITLFAGCYGTANLTRAGRQALLDELHRLADPHPRPDH